MLTMRTLTAGLLLLAAVGLIGLLAYTTSADAQVRRIGGGALQLEPVQITGSDEAMAILDPDRGVLLVVKWDALRERPIAVGARDLNADFQSSASRRFSMRAAADTSREDLLYVTDNDNRTLRIYRVNSRRETIEPITDILPLTRDGR